MVNHYELLYLVSGNYTEDELGPIKQKVADLVKKFDGAISFEDSLGKKKLAYPVNHTHHGYYILVEFDLEGEKLKELERNIGLTNEVLRHMVVKKPLKAAGAMTPHLKMGSLSKVDETPKAAVAATPEDKLKLDTLDQKLDEILEGDIM